MKTIAQWTSAVVAVAVLGLAGLATGGETKPEPGKKTDAARAGKKLELPAPPQEVADLMKLMGGTWKCTGKAWMPDGSEHEMVGTLTSKPHFDGFWAHDSWDGKMSGLPFKFDTYSTYDAQLKKWRRVSVTSLGGQLVGTSEGLKDQKMDFTMEVTGMMGALMLLEHIDLSDPRTGARLWTERTLDKGKTWQKDFELLCKK